jgi:hypothetical protein
MRRIEVVVKMGLRAKDSHYFYEMAICLESFLPFSYTVMISGVFFKKCGEVKYI